MWITDYEEQRQMRFDEREEGDLKERLKKEKIKQTGQVKRKDEK